MSSAFLWERRVEFHETDAAGIAHFSSLLIFMEQAEHALHFRFGFFVLRCLDSQRCGRLVSGSLQLKIGSHINQFHGGSNLNFDRTARRRELR